MALLEKVLHIRFNQTHNSFICCLESGVRVYSVDPLLEMTHLGAKEFGTMGLGEMLYRTSLLALVGGGPCPKYADNTVLIYDAESQKFLSEYTYSTKILALRVSKTKVIVALRKEIHVFAFPNQEELLFSCETGSNPMGLLEFTPALNSDRIVVCFPAQKPGSVQIVDLARIDSKFSNSPATIYAHENKLACLSLNQDGTMLATASERGTLIRVWDTAKRLKVAELRRGTDPATLYCINFSGDGEYLCCSSDKGTVHIFALKNMQLNKKSPLSVLKMLPDYVVDSQWGMTNFTVPRENACICAFGPNCSIYAICFDGSFHKYVFRSEDGVCKPVSFDSFPDICNHWWLMW